MVYKGAAQELASSSFPLFPSRSRRLYLRLLKKYESHVPCIYFQVSRVGRVGQLYALFFSIVPVEPPSLRTFFSFQSLCSFAFYKVAHEWLVQRPLWCAMFVVRSNRVSDEGFRAFSTAPSCIGMAFLNGSNCTRSSCHTARVRRRSD